MLLNIFLRNGNFIQVTSFKEFTVAYEEWHTYEAEKISSVKLIDAATYSFKGENTVMISGKDILYLDIT